MKHQISKVALIATLAFIGVGFAGTQQAKATDCPGSGDCGSSKDTCLDNIPANAFEIIISPDDPDTYDIPKKCQTHCGQSEFSDGNHTWANPCNGQLRATWTHRTNARTLSYKFNENGKTKSSIERCGEDQIQQGSRCLDT